MRYEPKKIESKWRGVWNETELYKTPVKPSDNKYYCLVMFPYPSGNLHVGHWYNFGPADAVARFNRMLGKDVLHPFGYDAFGLPAENAAIKRNIPPAQWTKSNIEYMQGQVESIGTMYDWDKLVNTSSPDYYKWTQWLFLKLYEKNLAYREKGLQNWCPSCQTVLANEQVVGENNECERCGTPVEKKELEQWFFKITEYADRLLDDLEDIDWPGRVKTMQENWIGRSVGAHVRFALADSEGEIEVFTTRPDTLFGATYMVLAPEHSAVDKITVESEREKVQQYVEQAQKKTELDRKEGEKDKTGVFTGAYAINPVNNEKIPIWVADYVLLGYGTGAIMAVPAHDERDYAFAQKFDIKIQPVIKSDDTPYAGEGEMINSGDYNGQDSASMREQIVSDLAKKQAATEKVNYKLRDWLISRQRYWGAPIPIIYCDDCGTVPEKYENLPVSLPEDVEFEPTGRSPLLDIEEFVNTKCPECGKEARRETDTMDTFVDSSWYFLRYPNNQYEDGPFDPEAVKSWMPVDHYIGGIEHAILHLLYARFITKFLHDHAELPFEEPFKKLSNQGIILGPDGNKMSKSKGNVVDPDEQVDAYGSDTLRLYLMFMGPYDQGGPYNFGAIAGVRRFIERVWGLVQEYLEEKDKVADAENLGEKTTELAIAVNKTTKSVTADLQELGFNTAIAKLMELTNTLNKLKSELPFGAAKREWHDAFEVMLRLAAPLAPHFTEELWHQLGNEESIHIQGWPTWDEELTQDALATIVVQVNGKVRDNLLLASDAPDKELEAAALASDKIKPFTEGKTIAKTIVVSGKLVNLVVR